MAESFSAIGFYEGPYSMNLTGVGEPAQVDVSHVTASLFQVLGVRARLGRTFDEKEDDPGAPQVAILSAAFWRSRFGGDPHVLGRTLELNATPWVIVGVMADGFTYPGGTTAIWVPYIIEPKDLGRVNFGQKAVGRLKPGVSVATADAELNRLLRRIPEIYPGEMTRQILDQAQLSAHINPMMEDVVGDVSRVLYHGGFRSRGPRPRSRRHRGHPPLVDGHSL
jgi:hypothetical protein